MQCLHSQYGLRSCGIRKNTLTYCCNFLQERIFLKGYFGKLKRRNKKRNSLSENQTSEAIRPVLRINAEILDNKAAYLEFNTPCAHNGKRGWLNIGFWNDVRFEQEGKRTVFYLDSLRISFIKTSLQGGCPAEKDNEGCFFLGEETLFRPKEEITANKEFCDCDFAWLVNGKENGGKSLGCTIAAVPSPQIKSYPREAFNLENLSSIECNQVLGSYCVRFVR